MELHLTSSEGVAMRFPVHVFGRCVTGKHTAVVTFQSSAVVYLRFLLFWCVTWCRLLVPYQHFGVTHQFCVNTQIVRYGILESLACCVDVQ